ncbi:TetR/AcrR family transcriptional regulator [Williamsia sterculiae]|nr:TetR family transcriptional regulator [Williamsia sterculiae]
MRQRLVATATTAFVEHGYHGATLRSIADATGCDPALIGYHFGSKSGLFAEVMHLRLAPAEVLAGALRGDPQTVGRRLADGLLEAWDDPVSGPFLAALIREAGSTPAVRDALAEYIDREIMDPLVEFFGGSTGRQNATAALTVLAGAIFTRYLVPVDGVGRLSGSQYREVLHTLLAQPIRRSRRL